MEHDSCERRQDLATTVIITLAVGISANTIIFSWIASIFFHPIPGVADADQLVVVVQGNPTGQDGNTVSYPDFRDLAAHRDVFAGAAGVHAPHHLVNMEVQGQSTWIWVQPVTPALFAFLGVKPQLGRTFLPEEESSERSPAVILSHKLWRKQFDSDPRTGKGSGLGIRQ